MSIVIDLKAKDHVRRIAYYDGVGSANVRVDAREGDSWRHLFTDSLVRYLEWTLRDFDVNTRYLRLMFETPAAQVGELLVDAQPLEPVASTTEPAPVRRGPLMDDFIGVNGFIDDPVERLAAFGHVREYHQWQWDAGNQNPDYKGYPDDLLAWSPSWVSGPGWGWDFDQFYRELNARGVEVVPCLQGSALYIHDHESDKVGWKPIKANEDTTDPQSYIEHASHLFQFAARYGATKVEDSLLKLREGQPHLSGLGLIRYLENWNEPDRWWAGRNEYFSPFELAAMSSADLDGHRGALGPTAGVRAADSQMKLVMGGRALPEIEYLRAMQLWAELNRNGEFPADVINLHHYSNDAGGQGGQPTTGISPEADGLRERFGKIARWRDEQLPDAELWMSEFGYDTNPNSVQRAPAIGDTPAEEVQACWIIRSFLELAGSGVDRAQLYMLRDVNAGNTVKYNSSGVTTETWNKHQPKRAWFYINTMKNTVKGTRPIGDVASDNERVRVMKFKSDDGLKTIFALWCPSANNEVVQGFQLRIPDKTTARIVQLEAGESMGKNATLRIQDSLAKIEVTERPVFVVC